jgi:hypothetical protein
MATLKSPFCGEKDNATSLIEKISTADYPPLPQDCYNVQVGMHHRPIQLQAFDGVPHSVLLVSVNDDDGIICGMMKKSAAFG